MGIRKLAKTNVQCARNGLYALITDVPIGIAPRQIFSTIDRRLKEPRATIMFTIARLHGKSIVWLATVATAGVKRSRPRIAKPGHAS
jgi:hypothetical protein